MIIEGIVTTLDASGGVNIAPMGVEVAAPGDTAMVLRPYQTAATFHNLARTRACVFHTHDDVLVFAKAAIGALDAAGVALERAAMIEGFILAGACRYDELAVLSIDDRGPRAAIECRSLYRGIMREFVGFQRARHAVLEAAILATRVRLLPIADIVVEIERFKPWVAKTGSEREREAFSLLEAYVRSFAGGSETNLVAE